MPQISVRLAPDIRQVHRVRQIFVTFIVNRDAELFGHTSEPVKILVIPRHDKFKRHKKAAKSSLSYKFITLKRHGASDRAARKAIAQGLKCALTDAVKTKLAFAR